MKILIGAIGRLKTGPERELAGDYEERVKALGRKVGITSLIIRDWAESQAPTPALRMKDEQAHLWDFAGTATSVLLDERGKTMSSAAFADYLARKAVDGGKDMAFLIGGPDGHEAQSRNRAHLVMSLGPMTFPHRLVRVLLLEQLYRALTIIMKHPYHRP